MDEVEGVGPEADVCDEGVEGREVAVDGVDGWEEAGDDDGGEGEEYGWAEAEGFVRVAVKDGGDCKEECAGEEADD